MNVQQLFEAIGNIDDRFIEEAASDAIPHLKWKISRRRGSGRRDRGYGALFDFHAEPPDAHAAGSLRADDHCCARYSV